MHVVVDGSNLATEGRTMPSLAQLDQAVREFIKEFPNSNVTVVVDGTFGYRIDESERQAYEEAALAGEIVSPPAGAIGRGDAFVLRIADKVGATVLSNDSFQEFHGEHPWLFDKERLIGGKPVPGVGWIFTFRSPVRGPKSREAVRVAKRQTTKAPAKGAVKAAPKREKAVDQAIQVATKEAVEPNSASASRRRRKRGGGPPAEPVNEPLTFITFVAEHPLGTEVTGEVDSFSSHGAFVMVGTARCYVPLTAISDPPPRSAREVLRRGEHRQFVVRALDPPRRGIELAMPGGPQAPREPVSVEAAPAPAPAKPSASSSRRGRRGGRGSGGRGSKSASPEMSAPVPIPTRPPPRKASAPKKARLRRAAVADPVTPEVAVPKKTAKKVAGPKRVAPKKVAVAKKVAPKKAAPVRKAAVKKATPKKAATTKKAQAKKATPKKAATKKTTATKKTAAKKSPAKKATATKRAATKKTTPTKKSTKRR